MLFEFGVTLGKMGDCCVLFTQLGRYDGKIFKC